jgi:hypothetical protein
VNDHRVVQKVLAEPFPWTVSQGVILVLVIINSQLKVLSWLLSTHDNQLEPWWVRLQLASIFASVFFEGFYCMFNNIICKRMLGLTGGGIACLFTRVLLPLKTG